MSSRGSEACLRTTIPSYVSHVTPTQNNWGSTARPQQLIAMYGTYCTTASCVVCVYGEECQWLNLILALILASSGPGRRCAVTGCSAPPLTPFIFCRFTFMMLHRKALLLVTCSRLLCLNSVSTSSARSAGNSLMASIARSSRSPSASRPVSYTHTSC